MNLKSIIIAVVSAIIGGAGVYFLIGQREPKAPATFQSQKPPEVAEVFDNIIEQQQNIHDQFDDLIEDDFFAQEDPFTELRKMRQKMQERIRQFQEDTFNEPVNPFDDWYSQRFGGGSIEDITQTEDEDFIYYKIKISDLESTTLKTKIENNMIHITGTIEKKDSDGDSAQTYFSSSFQRSFPLPTGVDGEKMEMSNEDDVVILKFPKTEDVTEAI